MGKGLANYGLHGGGVGFNGRWVVTEKPLTDRIGVYYQWIATLGCVIRDIVMRLQVCIWNVYTSSPPDISLGLELIEI
jgi:hypothetical protein